jgi:zinc D-Ala-D-Ala carboxypeptidase
MERGPLDSKYFRREEFTCNCGCGFDDINPALVKKLDEIREFIGRPIVVNCGCRCQKHNADVGGEKNSAHLRGNAADIQMPGSTFRYVFLRIAYARFTRIGIYKTFCHVDVDETLPQYVTWIG